MNNLKIAVSPGALSPDLYEGIKLASELDVQGLHIGAGGPWAPEVLDTAGRKELLKLIRSYGLEVSALSRWGGEVHFELPEHREKALAEGRATLEMAADMECGLWQAHIGVLPWETSDPDWARIVDCAGQLAAIGEEVGAALLIETGPEPPWVLKRLLEEVNSPALGINFDPANLIIWPVLLEKRGYGHTWSLEWADEHFNPQEGAKLLAPWVRHTHAKDALVQDDGMYLEVPLGEGWVDWPQYIGNLQAGGFDGFYAIEREIKDPKLDTLNAVTFLRNLPV